MPSELETRLAAALADTPTPPDRVRGRALHAALEALPARRRPARRAVAVAATLAAFAAAAAALAATGGVRVAVGPTRPATPSVSRLELPASARALAVVAGGRLWLTTRGGTRIEGLPVSAAELSPRALYVAAGLRRTLVAMAPDGRRAWALPVRGEVTAIAWAPDGLLLAYVVAGSGSSQLRMVEGDGDHDTLLARGVRNVRPSWRADSLALAYVDTAGRAHVDDRSRGTADAVSGAACAGRIGALSFAPNGDALAAGGTSGLFVGVPGGSGRCRPGTAPVTAVAWRGEAVLASHGAPLAATSGGVVVRVANGRLVGPDGRTLLALARGTSAATVAVR